MVFRGKKLSDLLEPDLQRLVVEQVQERDNLEYKGDMYGNSDDDKREMLKDITSIANHHGGYIVIGIDEDGEGIPTRLEGIEVGRHVERITGSGLDNIERRIVGWDVKAIPLDNGKAAIVISIPESINAPHMVTYRGLNQFWKRHGRQKDKMTIDEIGEAFDKRFSNLNRLDRFLFTRKTEILETIGDQTFMVICASPTYLRDEATIDIHDKTIRDIMLQPPDVTGSMGDIHCGQPYPSINGLRADNRTPYYTGNPPLRRYIEVFMNGYIEFGKLIRGDYFASKADTASIVNFMMLIEKIYEHYLPFIPIIVSIAIYNAKDMWLAVSDYPPDDKLERWQEQHLELGKFYAENMSEEGGFLPKNICDRLWQAFHREQCNLFDDAGNFQI